MNKYYEAYVTMGDSGVPLIDSIFRTCVVILVDIAEFLNISYEALNIIVFIIIQPALILLFCGLWLRSRLLNRLHMKSLSTYNSITSI